MKKIIAALLACMLAFALIGCSDKDAGENGGAGSPAAAKEISVDEVPASLTQFLWTFTDWYQGNNYDSAAPDDCLLLDSIISNGSCVDWSLYPDAQPVEHWDDNTQDPRGWSVDTTYSYKEYDKKTVDYIAKNVFNLSDEQLTKQIENGEARNSFYAEGDKYYCLIGGVGDPPTEYKLTSASYDGSLYYVDYDLYLAGETVTPDAAYSAVAGQKKDGDKEYWSLYRLERKDNNTVEAIVSDEPVILADVKAQRENGTVPGDDGFDVTVSKLSLTGVDAEGNTLWTYDTPACIPTELDTVEYVGTFGNKVLVNVQNIYEKGRTYDQLEHHLYALDANTGAIVWDNQDFTGASVNSAYDENTGMIYICGFYGPDCCAIDTANGSTSWLVGSIDDNYWWPFHIELKDDGIEIQFDGGNEESAETYYGYIGYDGTVFAG